MNPDVIAFAHALKRDFNKAGDVVALAKNWTPAQTAAEMQLMSQDLRGSLADSIESLEDKIERLADQQDKIYHLLKEHFSSPPITAAH
jgi:hypothetical protein